MEQSLNIPIEEVGMTLLNGDQVAARLNISRSFAFQLMRRGDIPTVRIGRCVRVRPEDLERYIVENLWVSENYSPDYEFIMDSEV